MAKQHVSKTRDSEKLIQRLTQRSIAKQRELANRQVAKFAHVLDREGYIAGLLKNA